MKNLLMIITLFISTASVAAPSKQDINETALKIAKKNAKLLVDINDRTLEYYISKVDILSSSNVTVNVTNSCQLTQNEKDFECTLFINQTNNLDETGESTLSIIYELQKDKATGLPSKELSLITIEVDLIE